MNTKKLFSISLYRLIPSIKAPVPWAHKLITPSPHHLHTLPKGASILATNIIVSYFSEGLINDARKLFDEIPERDVVAWTAMITGYTSCGHHSQAWALFYEMRKEEGGAMGVRPNAFTISSVLKACKGMGSSSCGAMVHGLATKCGLDSGMYVENAVMDMYATCSDSMDDACMVFQRIRAKNVVSWTTMIASYTHRGDGYAAIRVFREMLQEEVELTPFSCSITIRACTSICSHTFGKQIHGAVIKHGLESSLPVGNSLVDMYCRCGYLSEAYGYFNEMPERDLITWNTMIAGLERSHSYASLRLFTRMGSEGLSPNCFTFTSVIAACANLALINCGQQIHAGIVRNGLVGNGALGNALIDMYAKCGSVADAREIFNELSRRDLISWTTMMNGYGSHGYGVEAIGLFEEMVSSGIKPDQVMLMGVLSACSHAGLVNEGLKYFNSMDTDYRIMPDQEIYGCVVDLLGRAGRIMEAYELIKGMPFEPDESVWCALLGACKAHRVSNLARLAAQKLLNLRPNGAETYVILSSIYAADGSWGEFARMRKMMRGTGSRKEAGRSWIEVRNQVYSFVVGEKLASDIELVYDELKMLAQHMKEAGYVPDTDCLIHNLEAVT